MLNTHARSPIYQSSGNKSRSPRELPRTHGMVNTTWSGKLFIRSPAREAANQVYKGCSAHVARLTTQCDSGVN